MKRSYPKGSVACHILGFAGIDNQGLEGIEYVFDNILAGINGSIRAQYDAGGRMIMQAEYEYTPPVDGNDLYLTLDANIQYFCEHLDRRRRMVLS